jgi:hypothetical protein
MNGSSGCPSGKARSWGVSDLSTRFATLGGRTAIYFHCSIKSRYRSIWGCDWQNVPHLLPHTFTAYERLTNSKHVHRSQCWESMESPGRGRVFTSKRSPGSIIG